MSAQCEKQGLEERESPETWVPKDGGAKAWLVVFASFMTNDNDTPTLLIYFELQKSLEEAGVADSSSKASLVGSLTIGATFALSPVAGILTDRLGLQQTALLGGGLATLGMALSSVLYDQVEALYFTYGILFGLGASLAYTPSLAILGLHFRQKMGMVNGLVTAGSSAFTVALPPLLGAIIPWAGLQGVLRFLAICMACLMGNALLFKIPEGAIQPKRDTSGPIQLSSFINVEIWKKRRYVIWALAIPSAMLGYFVPYVHMKKFVSLEFPGENGAHLIMCIGVTSGVGRLIFGKIADLPRVDRILLQQAAFISIGGLTMLLTVASKWGWMLAIALGMGLFDGCFISLIGPIAFDLCGPANGAQAIGFLLGLMSIPLTLGPPIAGLVYDHTQSYLTSFLLSGLPPIFGGLALFLVRCVPEDVDHGVYKEVPVQEMEKGTNSGNLVVNASSADFTPISGGVQPRNDALEAESLLSGEDSNSTGLKNIYIEKVSNL